MNILSVNMSVTLLFGFFKLPKIAFERLDFFSQNEFISDRITMEFIVSYIVFGKYRT